MMFTHLDNTLEPLLYLPKFLTLRFSLPRHTNVCYLADKVVITTQNQSNHENSNYELDYVMFNI